MSASISIPVPARGSDARIQRMMPGERVLWEGRPVWQVVARDVMHVAWLALYMAAILIWDAASDRASGLGPVATLLAEVPLFLLMLAVLGAVAGFAYACARTTTYTVTTERCILRYGVALTATLSLPYRRFAAVSVRAGEGGTADILFALKSGAAVRFFKLWPHVRPWRLKRPQPMLRGVPDGAAVAALISRAVAEVSTGVVHPGPPVKRATRGPAASVAGMGVPEAGG